MKKEIIICTAEAYYDLFSASDSFKDNFSVIKEGFFFYTDWGNLAAPEVDELLTISERNSKKKLIAALAEIDNASYGDDDEMMTWNKADLIDELLMDTSISELSEFLSILSNNGVQHTKNYIIASFTGYSQHDYTEVIILKETVKGLNRDALKERLHHYIYDSPIYFQVVFECVGKITEEITPETFSEYDEYESWEDVKEKISKYVFIKHGAFLSGIVDKMLPDRLEHRG